MKYIIGLLLLVVATYFAVSLGWVAAVFAWWAAFLAIGTVGFYGLLVVCVVAMWWIEATSWGRPGDDHPAALALIPFAIWCVIVHFLSNLNLIAWVRENWGSAAAKVGWYLLVGFVFFVIRWVIHVVEKRDLLDQLDTKFRQDNDIKVPLNEAPDEVRFRFTEFLSNRDYNPDVDETKGLLKYYPASDGVWPTVRRNWRIISCWLFWWPFEIPRFFFGKMWQKIIRGLREFLANMADWCSKRYFGNRSGYVVDKAKYEELRRRSHERS